MSMTVLLGAMIAAAALAETELGSRSTIKARQGVHSYGYCLATERPKDVRALLAMDFREPDYGKTMRNLVNTPAPCPGVAVPRGAYSSGTLLWGGALAEGLMRRDSIVDQLAVRTSYRPELPNIEARNPGELMAFCVVRTDPAGTAGLLRTTPATVEEHDAIKQLGLTLGKCVPANSTSRFTRESLRALIALGTLRLAQHNEKAAK